MSETSKFTASYWDGNGYVGSSVPMALEDARAFLLGALDRARLGPGPHVADMRTRARDMISETQRPMRITAGLFTFALESEISTD